MKTKISLLTAMFLIGFVSVFANTPPENDRAKKSACNDARLELNYPNAALEQDIEGIVYVQCVVQEDGKVMVLESNSGCGLLCTYVTESLSQVVFDPDKFITGEPFNLKYTFEIL